MNSDFRELLALFDKHSVEIDGQDVAFISLEDLILAKRAAGRPQDLLDLKKLERRASH
jgi:predicted nucleotidyltransferase